GLQHLRDRTERLPGQLGVDPLDLPGGNTGVLRITPVERPSHAAHHGRNDIALREPGSRRALDDADRLYAEDAGKRDARRIPLPGEHLGTIQPEGPAPKEHLPVHRRRDWAAL